jgi:hypothetical protein
MNWAAQASSRIAPFPLLVWVGMVVPSLLVHEAQAVCGACFGYGRLGGVYEVEAGF